MKQEERGFSNLKCAYFKLIGHCANHLLCVYSVYGGQDAGVT